MGTMTLVSFLMYFRYSFLADEESAVNDLGLVCDAVTIVQFFAPLSALGDVLRTKSSETIPLGLVSINFAVSGLWWFYGYLLEDKYILVSGLFFSFRIIDVFFSFQI